MSTSQPSSASAAAKLTKASRSRRTVSPSAEGARSSASASRCTAARSSGEPKQSRSRVDGARRSCAASPAPRRARIRTLGQPRDQRGQALLQSAEGHYRICLSAYRPNSRHGLASRGTSRSRCQAAQARSAGTAPRSRVGLGRRPTVAGPARPAGAARSARRGGRRRGPRRRRRSAGGRSGGGCSACRRRP